VVPLGERGQHRQQGLGLGFVPFEAAHLQWEAGRVAQQTELDLRVDAAFLAHADLAQPVFVLDLKVQRGHVVEHQ
jgi:hypothetical protein